MSKNDYELTTLNIMTLSIMTLSIMTLNIKGKYNDNQHYDT